MRGEGTEMTAITLAGVNVNAYGDTLTRKMLAASRRGNADAAPAAEASPALSADRLPKLSLPDADRLNSAEEVLARLRVQFGKEDAARGQPFDWTASLAGGIPLALA